MYKIKDAIPDISSDYVDNRIFKKGEVYYINLEDTAYGTKHLQAKTRPGLIIQNNVGNTRSDTLIVALITSSDKRPYPFQYKTNINGRESTILLEQIMTVDKFRVLSKLTELTAQQMREVDSSLMYSLDLTRYSYINITNIEVLTITVERNRSGEFVYFIFEVSFNNMPKSEIKVSLDNLQKFNSSIDKEIDFDNLVKIIDCCKGMNWIINHNENY